METKHSKDANGRKCKDIITGFEGTIIGTVSYLTGCDQYLVAPKCEEPNKKLESFWFDKNRVELTDDEVVELETDEDKGACESAPAKEIIK